MYCWCHQPVGARGSRCSGSCSSGSGGPVRRGRGRSARGRGCARCGRQGRLPWPVGRVGVSSPRPQQHPLRIALVKLAADLQAGRSNPAWIMFKSAWSKLAAGLRPASSLRARRDRAPLQPLLTLKAGHEGGSFPKYHGAGPLKARPELLPVLHTHMHTPLHPHACAATTTHPTAHPPAQ